MYYLYLGKILAPITPSKIQIKSKSQNKTLTLINHGVINMIRKEGLKEISFDLLIPNYESPFAVYKSGFKNAKYFINEIGKLKAKPFQFILTREYPGGGSMYNTNITVTLETADISDDVNNGLDTNISIKLKEYRYYGVKKCEITKKAEETVIDTQVVRFSDTQNCPLPSQNETYTVVAGDSLWAIAKKFYGNGAEFEKIFNANKDKIGNPSLIYPGQVLLIPKT